MSYRRQVLVATGLLAAFLLIGRTPPAHGASFTVNSTLDAVDAVPGDGACADATDACTLRAAIMETNALAGADEITLPPGTYTLTIPGQTPPGVAEAEADFGDLDIRDHLTLNGEDAETTIIDAGGLYGVVDVDPVPIGFRAIVQFYDVTIRNGGAGGGGIHNFGELTVTRSIITHNIGTGVGGITNGWTLALVDSVVSENTNNVGFGGGIRNAGIMTVNDSTITGNKAVIGGGVANLGSTALIEGSTIVNNEATEAGGGIFNAHVKLTATESTIQDNSALQFGGGGIHNSGDVDLSNVTLTGNTAIPQGGGILNGGGITPGALSATNVTINANSASQGASISNVGSREVTLKNSIVANGVGGGGCDGVITSQGHNLGSDNTCSFTATGDRLNTDPLLVPLADNGGPTQTHALLTGSPAIDAGYNGGCPATDQRGVERPRDGDGDGAAACDMGSYEAAGALPSPAPSASPTSTPAQAPIVFPPTGGGLGAGPEPVAAEAVSLAVLLMGGAALVATARRRCGRRLRRG